MLCLNISLALTTWPWSTSHLTHSAQRSKKNSTYGNSTIPLTVRLGSASLRTMDASFLLLWLLVLLEHGSHAGELESVAHG